jgi:hypothetical protein
MQEGAHGGEVCGIRQCKVVNLRQCQTQIVDRVDGYSLLPNHCVLATCLQRSSSFKSICKGLFFVTRLRNFAKKIK